MRNCWTFIFALSLTLSMYAVPRPSAGEVLDRVVATVNGHVILLSDWDDELRFECFTSGRKFAEVTTEAQKAALDRLIEQELLREQGRASDAKAVPPEQIHRQIESLKNDSLKNDSLRVGAGNTWETLLSEYRLTDKIIEGRVATELQQMQMIDNRLRPSIQVSQSEIEQYYKDQLVPKLPASDPTTLPAATPKIREILVQNKINQMLPAWLETLRSQAQIRILIPDSDTASGSSQAGAQ
jgi:peptidyl-prolyl cis-trans isomerase SurA